MNWIFKMRTAYLLFSLLVTACAATSQQRPHQVEGEQIPTPARVISSTVIVLTPPAPEKVDAPLQAANSCPLTKPVIDEPPKDPNAPSFGREPWYVNDDRSIWAGLPPNGTWHAGGEKVIWIRPAGTDLEISGRRLDGEAPPLRADIPCCYPTGFQVTGLIFPSEGCWEVTARAGESQLRFVSQVAPNRMTNRRES